MTEITLPKVTAQNLMTMDIEPFTYVANPVLIAGGIGLIYAKAGRGKTFFCLEFSYAIANGVSFLNWEIVKPHKVLYIDGELHLTMLQQRIKEIHERRKDGEYLDNIMFFNQRFLSKNMPQLNIDSANHRDAISNFIQQEGVEVLVLDNLSGLKLSSGENDVKDVNDLSNWIKKLRSWGITTIMIHHESKKTEGDYQSPRGSSKLEDFLDISINLRKGSEPHLREIHFRKSRNLSPEQAKDFVVSFSPENGWNVIGDYIDQSDELTKQRDLKVLDLKIAGKNNDEIAKEVGLQNKGTISKIITECKFIKDEMRSYLDTLFAQKKQNHEIAAILHIKPTSLSKLLFNCYGGELPEFINLSTNCDVETLTNNA